MERMNERIRKKRGARGRGGVKATWMWSLVRKGKEKREVTRKENKIGDWNDLWWR